MEATYKIVGSDGNEYGPVTLEQFQAWIKEGRLTPATQVLRSDVNVWHPASSYTELGLVASSTVGAPMAATTPSGTLVDAGAVELVELDKRVKSGGSWFYWIAGLSLINSIAAFSGSGYGFIVGLSLTQVIDHLLQSAGGSAKVIALVLDVLAAGIFVVFGIFACKRQAWAFIVGMALYGIDTLFTLVAQYWLGVAFHAWVLFSLFVGMKAALQINRVNRNSGV